MFGVGKRSSSGNPRSRRPAPPAGCPALSECCKGAAMPQEGPARGHSSMARRGRYSYSRCGERGYARHVRVARCGLQGRTVIGQCRFPGAAFAGVEKVANYLDSHHKCDKVWSLEVLRRWHHWRLRSGGMARVSCRACHAAGRSSSFHTRPCVATLRGINSGPHFVLPRRRGDDGIDGRWARPRRTMAAATGVAFSLLTRRRTTAGKREKLLCRQPQGAPQGVW